MDMALVVAGVIISAISVLSGITLPFILRLLNKSSRLTEKRMLKYEEDMEKVFELMGSLKIGLNNTDNAVDAHQEKIMDLKYSTNSRFKIIEKKIDKIEELVSEIQKALIVIEAAMDNCPIKNKKI